MALVLIILLFPALLLGVSFQKAPAHASRNAYVFYATQDVYACSIAVNVHLLKAQFRTKHRIIVLLSSEVALPYRHLLEDLGASIVDEEPLPLHRDTIPYYRGCLLKLASFRMHEIDPSLKRIITLDADQLILGNLDDLFELSMTSFLAATAYWIDSTCLSSTLMLIEPSISQWGSVQQLLANPSPQQYDMDIVNKLFQHQLMRLSGRYVTLNSHWEDWNYPPWYKSMAPMVGSSIPVSEKYMTDLYINTKVVHFTAVGKPWMYDVNTVRRMKPDSHFILYHQWETWRQHALSLCPPGILDHV